MKSKYKYSNKAKASCWPVYLGRVLNLPEAYLTHMKAKIFDYPAIIATMK